MTNIAAGSYAISDLTQSADAHFVRPYQFMDAAGGDPCNLMPADLTGRGFFFTVYGLDGSPLAELEIGDGITVADNLVAVTLAPSIFEEWPKNCDLKYKFWQVLPGGRIYPLFKGKFKLTT